MKPRFLFALSALIGSVLTTSAQYTETINSNRPGTSQGAFAVGNEVLQLELGAAKGRQEHRILETESDAFTIDYSIRYGLLIEQLELSFSGNYLSESVTDYRNPNNTFDYDQSNFRSNTLGVKYLVYDPYKKRVNEKPNIYSYHANNKFHWRELIPAISVYAGLNIDSDNNPYVPPMESRFSPKLLLATQNNFEGGWVFVSNIIVDRISSDYPSYSYILTLTHAFTPKISMFVENQGIKSDFYADQLLRFGGAYLFTQDFQLDASATVNFKDTPSLFYVGIGVSYRLDMHSRDEVIEEKGKKGSKEEDKNKKQEEFLEEGLDDGKE